MANQRRNQKIGGDAVNLTIFKRKKHQREDGFLVELFSETYKDFSCKHSYMVAIKPGATRAQHYHNEKKEVITSLQGKVEITLEDIKTKQRKRRIMNADTDNFGLLLINPGIAHSIKNIGKSVAKVIVFCESHNLDDVYKYEFK